jgi:hypothetical protein
MRQPSDAITNIPESVVLRPQVTGCLAKARKGRARTGRRNVGPDNQENRMGRRLETHAGLILVASPLSAAERSLSNAEGRCDGAG